MRIETQETKITNLINKHLTGWTWRWDTAHSRYGCCRHHQKLITISKPLANLNEWSETKDTVLHEIAHAIVGPTHGHDKVWKNACRMIGARPERCYSSSRVVQPAPKYFAICPNCKKVHYINRMPRRRRYSCGRCSNGVFNPDYILNYQPNPLSGYSAKDLINPS